ncbi:MAG TPA: SidA/IucD/PvdA family monooxygenase [Candidatus Obscuribacter sp.]|nr:SidA/IucD/PvdA family monooxygenase [Candidatus Obscuribacter sp.]
MNNDSPRLAILGAGPKSCAIWTKHVALMDEGITTAPISIIERSHVAANWTGAQGYTDGTQYLVSPSEQDLGFPYSSEVFGAKLTPRLTARMFKYSWQNFLLSVGGYPEWVARDRPRAPHFQFSDYLGWAARAAKLQVIQSEIAKISIDDQNRWRLESLSGEVIEVASGLVVTGNGKPRRLAGQPSEHDRIWDGETYWMNKHKLSRSVLARIAVIGSGETAAAIACSMLDHISADAVIELICKQYAYFTRADVAKDLIHFSDPSYWRALREGRRISIMRRADRGVVSGAIKAKLEESKLVEYTTAEAHSIEVSPQDEIFLTLKYGGHLEKVDYQFVVIATGFDAMWFFELFDEPVKLRLMQNIISKMTRTQIETLETALDSKATADIWLSKYAQPSVSRILERSVELLIDKDLSIEGFVPKLHLPMLAGLNQGPGFPNLNCLGLLADRILKSYLV